MSPSLPDIPGLDAYLQVGPEGATLRNPARDFVIQGLLFAILLPSLLAFVGVLVAFGAVPEGPPGRGLHPFTVVVGALTFMACGLALGAGLVQAALGPWRSGRSQVRVPADGGDLVLAGGARLARVTVQRVRVGRPSSLLKWQGIIAETGTGDVVVLGRLPPSRSQLIGGLAEYLAADLGVPVDTRDALSGPLGMGAREQATACYLPLQGVWIIASILVLIFSKDDFARFAAKQSLSWFVLSTAALLALIGCGAGGGSALAEVHEALAVGWALVFILPAALVRLGVLVYATARAWQGRAWVMPGLGWLVRRWLPAEESWPLRRR